MKAINKKEIISDYIAAVITQGTGFLKLTIIDGEIVSKVIELVDVYKEHEE